MVSRTAYEQLNNSILNLILSIFGLFMLYIFPLMSLIFFKSRNIYSLHEFGEFAFNDSYVYTYDKFL